jgi:hypothetical protein
VAGFYAKAFTHAHGGQQAKDLRNKKTGSELASSEPVDRNVLLLS